MGVFDFLHPDYNKPGPGIGPDTPREKGLARLWEVLSRDFFTFYKAGLLSLIGLLPFVLGVAVSVHSRSFALMALAGVLGGMTAAPELVGLFDTILRSLRDEVGYWWGTYRRVWKESLRSSLLPGALFGLLLSSQLFALQVLSATFGFFLILMLAFALTTTLCLYVFVQLALVRLPFFGMLRNALILLMSRLPRTLLALLILYLYAGVVYFLYPVSLLIVLLAGVWLPCLMELLAIYQVLDESFQIEDRVQELHERERNKKGE